MAEQSPLERISVLHQDEGPGFHFDSPGQLPTSSEINDELFERPEVTLPPAPTWHREKVAPEKPKPKLVTLEGLVAQMTTDDIALRESAEREGMPKPRFAIIAGLPFGDNADELLAGAVEYGRTGELPAPVGDGMSYYKVLIKQCADAGVEPVLYVGEEVRRQGDLDAYITSLGLDPTQVFATNHNLGILEDLAKLQGQVTYFSHLRQEYSAMLEERRNREQHTPNEQNRRIQGHLVSDIHDIDQHLQPLLAAREARLAEEDAKIAAIVAAEDANEKTAGVIAIMQGFTSNGMTTTRLQFKTNRKDVDGLSLFTPREERLWDEATSRAMVKSAEYMLGYPLSRVPRRQRLQLGLGQLVGRRLRDLWQPGRVIDGRENIIAWGQDHGQEEVSVVMSAARGAHFIKANQLVPARRGPFGLFGDRRLIIVDGGVVSCTDPVTGKRELRGNLDPDSLPLDGSVEAASGRNTVGIVTAAVAVGRVIRSALMAHDARKKAAPPVTGHLRRLLRRTTTLPIPVSPAPTHELVNA